MPAKTSKDTTATGADTFDIRSLVEGASTVTRTVEVCFKPQLLGQYDALVAQIERLDATTRSHRISNPARNALVRDLDDVRDSIIAATKRVTVRGLRNGEAEKIRAGLGDKADEKIGGDDSQWTRGDHAVWAEQITHIDDVPTSWSVKDVIDLHEAFGNYFVLTIAQAANNAHYAVGVDIPFSSKYSEPSQE